MTKINAQNIKSSKRKVSTQPNTDITNEFALLNPFIKLEPENKELPEFLDIKAELPQPFWDNHQNTINCYWKTWEIAFSNLRKPKPKSGFVSNFIDSAFYEHLYMWDSAFIVLFGRYGTRVFNFQKTLDNFYAHQHEDGYICRTIREVDGADTMIKYEPSSTGPNILPWAEWEYFLHFENYDRLKNTFNPLLAFYQWFRTYRTWQNGTYYSSGWGSGMDNQPRLPNKEDNPLYSHGHMSWIDTTLQQILVGKILIKMARILDETEKVSSIETEVNYLTQFVNEKMWDHENSFYYDMYKDGTLSKVKSVAAFWALIADIVPKDRLSAFIAHLKNEKEFNRPHRVPTLSADHEKYNSQGDYFRGGVWAPTNYMILRGLNNVGEDALAHEIALNTLNNVVEVFNKTRTLWENYAPESASPGNPAKADMVGWTGLIPIAILFENVFGLRRGVKNDELIWDIRLLEKHGIKKYPFDKENVIDIVCDGRKNQEDEPKISITSKLPFKIVMKWKGNKKVMNIQ